MNYPMGSDTKNAPWNEGDKPAVNVNVLVSTTLSKSTTIGTDDYESETWTEVEDDDGERYVYGGTDYDFSNSDLRKAYEDYEWTISEMLDKLGEYVAEDLRRHKGNRHTEGYLRHLLECTQGWTVDEFEVIKDE